MYVYTYIHVITLIKEAMNLQEGGEGVQEDLEGRKRKKNVATVLISKR